MAPANEERPSWQTHILTLVTGKDQTGRPLSLSSACPCTGELTYRPASEPPGAKDQLSTAECGAARAERLAPSAARAPLLPCLFAGSLASFLLSLGVAVGIAWGRALGPECLAAGHGGAPVGRDHPYPVDPCYNALSRFSDARPFRAITGKRAHELPELLGRIPEKTIWSYWYDPDRCPSRSRCSMPAHIQLCAETIERNRGSFQYRVVFMDEVDKYVSMMELPLHWHLLQPSQQKDALMNALLARYGGVALDISTVLFKPFDEDWDEMVRVGATFRGFAYRANGKAWHRPEVTATWYLMSRREGIFSSAVLSQATTMCTAYQSPKLALGDRALTPALSGLSDLARCSEDSSVHNREVCPDLAQPSAPRADRNDMTVLLADPRDGPAPGFAMADGGSMGKWRIDDHARIPGYCGECCSMQSCWEILKKRFDQEQIQFVKLFHTGGALWQLNRAELVDANQTFFYNWLVWAGMNIAQLRATSNPVIPGDDTATLENQTAWMDRKSQHVLA